LIRAHDAVARILMPASHVRLSAAGQMSDELQAWFHGRREFHFYGESSSPRHPEPITISACFNA